MKHIALNTHLLSRQMGYRQAGIHRYMFNLLMNLPLVDDEHFHYTALAHHDLDHPSHRFATQVSRFETSSPVRRILWEQTAQPLALWRLKPDLYHALAFVGPWTLPCPSVATVYDLGFVRFPEILTAARRRYLTTFTRFTCQRATRVIAISQSTADDLITLMGIDPAKIDIAYPGVSDGFQPLPEDEIETFRRQQGLPDRFFLFLGTLEPRKNLPMLLRAYAQLTQSDRDAVHLVLGGGKGWLYDEIFETIARLRLEDTVLTPGYIAGDELAMWYNAAEALVIPSLFEGFGIPIVEALACGLPVLAADNSSLPEAAGGVSVLLPPHDEVAWTQALAARIHGQPFVSTRQERIEWAKTFTWQRTACQTVESYHRALSHDVKD
jgi:glycosyltransferase involved in cell wall biosynthesis